jgi:hypothetical protein
MQDECTLSFRLPRAAIDSIKLDSDVIHYALRNCEQVGRRLMPTMVHGRIETHTSTTLKNIPATDDHKMANIL